MTTTTEKPPFPAGGLDRNCEIALYVIDMLDRVANRMRCPVKRPSVSATKSLCVYSWPEMQHSYCARLYMVHVSAIVQS